MTNRRTTPDDGRALISRRRLFGASGMVSLGVLAAACSGEESSAPGRVGDAPTPTPPPPPPEPDDVLFLRTAASVEYTIIDLYGDIRSLDALDPSLSPLLDEFVRRHEANADRVNELVRSNGGEPWTCANPWLVDRFTGPMVELIANGQGEIRPRSDDPTRDAFNTLTSFENLAGATYQQLVADLSAPELRQAAAELASGSARRGAFLAYTATGTPEGYVFPEISGAPPDEEAEGEAAAEEEEEGQGEGTPIEPMYAMRSRFGNLGSFTLPVGAPDQDGARREFMLETPAENSYIYPDTQCPPSEA